MVHLNARWSRVPGRWLAVARWAIGLAVLAFLLLRWNLGDIAGQLRHANLALVVPAIVGLVAMHLVGAATWRLLVMRMTGARPGWPASVRTYYVAQAIGGLTPGNIGADAYRLYVAGGDAGWRGALAPIVVQRVTSSVALAALAIAALLVLPRPGEIVGMVAGAAIILAIASSLVAFALRRPMWPGRTRRRRPDTPANANASASDGSSTRGLLRSALPGLGLGLVFHTGSILLSSLLVASVSPIPNPMAVIASITIARLSILVPISPSGLGVQEGALTLLFLRIGLPAETALAAALLNRVALLATAAVGGALLLSARRPAGEGVTTSSQPVPFRSRP